MSRFAAAALVAALALTGCGGGDTNGATSGGSTETPTEAQNLDAKPQFDVPSDQQPPNQLVVEDLAQGDGETAEPGDRVQVHYVGKAWSTGEQFDSSWDRGQPFAFALGEGQVIEGWDEGVAGMQVGGRRRLVIPPDMAYGEQGAGGAIGPNETLVFVVDLIAVE